MKLKRYKLLINYKISLIRIIGFFGVDLLRISERIINKKNNYFFNAFISKSDQKDFTLDEDFVRNLISKRFKYKHLHDELISILTKLYLLRISHKREILESSKMKALENLVINSEVLSIEERFFISKFLSRLGLFSVANCIENKIFYKSKSFSNISTIYDIFQIVKIELYSNPREFESYLKKIKLYKHMDKFFNISLIMDLFVVNFKETNKLSNLILGPLRDQVQYDDLLNYNCMLVKPNKYELNKIDLTNLINKLYLYVHKTYSPEYINLANVINVVEYSDRVTSTSTLTMSYSSNFYLINGFPHHLQRVLLHQILEKKQRRFLIDHFSFYLSHVLSSPNYLFPQKNVEKMTHQELNHLIWHHGWHDLLSNFRFGLFLHDNDIIESRSELLSNILDMSVEEYALNLEKLYSN